MSRSSGKFPLLSRVSLVDQKAAGLERRNQSREELPLEIEEHDRQIVLFPSEIRRIVQIQNLGFNGHISLARILLGHLNANFRNVHQLHLPAALGQPQRMRSEERRVGKECRSRWP